LASICLGFCRSQISWLLSWTSNLWKAGSSYAERLFVWIEKPFQARPSKPGLLVKRCVRTNADQYFFAVSFICAGVLSRALQPLVGKQVFQENHSGLCGDDT